MNLYGYVGGNPVNCVDPYGLWTFQLGINAAGGAAAGGTAEAGLVLGYSRRTGFELGTYETVGGGGYGGLGGSITLAGSISGNAGIGSISGGAGQVGGSADVGLTVAAEVNVMDQYGPKPTYTGSVGVGLDVPIPVELHGFETYTWVQHLLSSRRHLPPMPAKVKAKL